MLLGAPPHNRSYCFVFLYIILDTLHFQVVLVSYIVIQLSLNKKFISLEFLLPRAQHKYSY